MSNDQILDQEIRVLGRGEYNRKFYYPNTCQDVRKMFKPVIMSKYPEDHKFTMSRISRRRNEYIPFLNERDQMGRLIPSTKNSSNNSPLPGSNQEQTLIEFPIKEADTAADSNTANTSFKQSKKRYSLGSINPVAKMSRSPSHPKSLVNSQSNTSQIPKQNSILPLLINESTGDANSSQFSTPILNASYLRDESKDKLSNYFVSPGRLDVYAEIAKHKSTPSVGHYEPKDDFMRARIKNISFGSLPKFYQANRSKVQHEYDLDFQKSFENTQEKSQLVPNFAKQSDRISSFEMKNGHNDHANMKEFEKVVLGEKFQSRRKSELSKDLEEVQKRRNLSYHLNEKYNPLDHRGVEDSIRTLKLKYNLRVGFKLR